MGYTHYWRRPKKNNGYGSAYMFGKLALDAKKIIAQAEINGIKIRGSHGDGEPNFNEASFGLNGDGNLSTNGHKDLSHESFIWEGIPSIQEWSKDEPATFDFCKTAYKPYDVVVTAILIRAKYIYGDCVSISSDGDFESYWREGRYLYEQVFGEVAKCPFDKASV